MELPIFEITYIWNYLYLELPIFGITYIWDYLYLELLILGVHIKNSIKKYNNLIIKILDKQNILIYTLIVKLI